MGLGGVDGGGKAGPVERAAKSPPPAAPAEPAPAASPAQPAAPDGPRDDLRVRPLTTSATVGDGSDIQLDQGGLPGDAAARRALAAGPAVATLPLADLEALCDPRQQDRQTLLALARNPHTPTAALLRLAHASQDPEVRREVAGQTRTVPAKPTELDSPAYPAALEDYRQGVAEYERLQQALARLSDDPDREVCLKLAANPDTPATTLARLASHTDPEVRLAVAGHSLRFEPGDLPRADAVGIRDFRDALARLLRDTSAEVREAAAANPDLPISTLRELIATATDPDDRLALEWGLAARRFAPDPRRFQEDNAAEARALQDALAALATHPDAGVRKRLAENPSTPAAAQGTLAGDADPRVRLALATNQEADPAALARLAAAPDTGVVLTGDNDWTRPPGPPRPPEPGKPPPEKLDPTSAGDYRRVLLLRLVGNSRLPREQLQELARHSDARVREAAEARLKALPAAGQRP